MLGGIQGRGRDPGPRGVLFARDPVGGIPVWRSPVQEESRFGKVMWERSRLEEVLFGRDPGWEFLWRDLRTEGVLYGRDPGYGGITWEGSRLGGVLFERDLGWRTPVLERSYGRNPIGTFLVVYHKFSWQIRFKCMHITLMFSKIFIFFCLKKKWTVRIPFTVNLFDILCMKIAYSLLLYLTYTISLSLSILSLSFSLSKDIYRVLFVGAIFKSVRFIVRGQKLFRPKICQLLFRDDWIMTF